MTFLVTVATGAVGAYCRYLVSGAIQSRSHSDFPLGTLSANLGGAFLIGLVTGASDLQSTSTLAAVGFLGGFTTYSTWMIETIRLGMPYLRVRAVINLMVTLILGIGLTVAGYSLTT
jgi:CrcB protein